MCRHCNPFVAAAFAFKCKTAIYRIYSIPYLSSDPVLVVILAIRRVKASALQSSLVETFPSGKIKFIFTVGILKKNLTNSTLFGNFGVYILVLYSGLFVFYSSLEILTTTSRLYLFPQYFHRPTTNLSGSCRVVLGWGSHGLANEEGKGRGWVRAEEGETKTHQRFREQNTSTSVEVNAQTVPKKDKKSLVSLVSSTRLKGQMESQ